jgi:hypothetical protein
MADVVKQIQKMELDLSQVTRTKSVFNQNQIQKLWNSTSPKFKYQRPAKGGGNWTYVKASYVRKVMDSVFGFDWDLDIETTVGEAFEVAKLTNAVIVKGILSGRVVDDSGRIRTLKKVQFGRAEVKWLTETKNGVKSKKFDDFTGAPVPLDFGNDMKAAATDAFKKCASYFGVASDVYEADEFVEILITDSQEAKDKEVNKKVQSAKKLLKKEAEKVGEQNEKPKAKTPVKKKKVAKKGQVS